jgi:pimeloyl-ACP methyl ester carboxylesterase
MMADLPTKLAKRLDEVFIEGEQKVSLVGWSMGGVYARMLAQLYPGKVRQVITLGSPFSTPRTTSSYRTVAKVRSLSIEQIPAPDLRLLASEPLDSVPSTAIFSKSDGVVSWQIASQQPSDIAENIEVYTSHLGLGFSPAVLYALADRLKHPTDNWQKFKRTGWKRFVYGPANLSSPQGRAKTRSNITA